MNRQLLLWLTFAAIAAPAISQQPTRVELSCHRTANKDVPEDTLESLEEAALLGCDIVEIDIRRTLDGKLVLNHDGTLERFTDGIGELEHTYYDDLRLRDAGSWMGDRFQGIRFPLFVDALRMAHYYNLRLYLDIKEKGNSKEILEQVEREHMLDRVHFGGEWEEVTPLHPHNAPGNEVWLGPMVTTEEVSRNHRLGKRVIANFSANGHGMDLAGMKSAVAAGVDGINVDYPRLGADAVGRPVEQTISRLVQNANAGDASARIKAILILSRYHDFPLQDDFERWLLDPDDAISRAAAVALVTARPHTSPAAFAKALHSKNESARANAAWALGMLHAPAAMVSPLLRDKDPRVLAEALTALAHMPGYVAAKPLLQLLSNPTPSVRSAAAVALAAHQPGIAVAAVTTQLKAEMKTALAIYSEWAQRGKPPLTQQEKDKIVIYYRCQVKEMQALAMLHGPAVTQALVGIAFRPGKDFAEMNSIMAAFQLWDRISEDVPPAIAALGQPDADTADRAEWTLIHGDPSVLLQVRHALSSKNDAVRQRAIRILAWQGDVNAVPLLSAMTHTDRADADLLAWAIDKIHTLHPDLPPAQ